MDATLTDEQEQMQETFRDFLESAGGTELARRAMDGTDDPVDDLWTELTEMDYTALTVPVEHGGLGEGMRHLCSILEVAGRFAMPGPFPETMGAFVPLVAELGSAEQHESLLPAVADGGLIATFALYDDRTRWLPDSIRTTAREYGDGFRIDGTKTLVPYGAAADCVVVAARTCDNIGYDGVSLFLVDPTRDGVQTSALDGLDRTRSLVELAFDDVYVKPGAMLGQPHAAGSHLRNALDRLSLSYLAILVGGADAAVDRSVEYGNEREQYGHPVGRFQAVKHRIVNMWVEMQSARSLVWYAAWAIDTDQPDASNAVASANVFAADRLHDVIGRDIWNHGGTGFTWDYDGHLYLKRAKAWRNLYATPEQDRDRLARVRLDGA
jgi:alkylation response protein AidB-like acyl-CoA dehydrogenase